MTNEPPTPRKSSGRRPWLVTHNLAKYPACRPLRLLANLCDSLHTDQASQQNSLHTASVLIPVFIMGLVHAR
eukprot:1428475-Amphidinium_carterae.1